MYMAALVRMFAVVGPRRPAEHVTDAWWADISYNYVCALGDSGIPLRVIAIGGAMFQHWEHWRGLNMLFQGDIDPGFVNIVCCPPGLITGRAVTGKAVAPAGAKHHATDEIVYQPDLALVQLWTKGQRNIAITGMYPTPPSEAEVEALKNYDAVLTPTEVEAEQLAHLGVDACAYPAWRLRREAKSLPILLNAP